MGIASCSLKQACLPNKPGWTKSTMLHNSLKLFIIGLPLKMNRAWQLTCLMRRVVRHL